METFMMICLLLIIYLLLKDKIIIKKTSQKQDIAATRNEYPDIMGQPKKAKYCSDPTEENLPDPNEQEQLFQTGMSAEIEDQNDQTSSHAFDHIFGPAVDLEEEEEEWKLYSHFNDINELAQSVTFEELGSVSTFLKTEELSPIADEEVVDFIQKIHGTELLDLLENSIHGASQKIAELLEKKLPGTYFIDSGNSEQEELKNFDISKFV